MYTCDSLWMSRYAPHFGPATTVAGFILGDAAPGWDICSWGGAFFPRNLPILGRSPLAESYEDESYEDESQFEGEAP